MKNIFRRFPTSKLTLIKNNSSLSYSFEGVVSSETIFVDDTTIIIEENDIIERQLTNGAIESFLVHDRGYFEEFCDIPAHYQVKVKKTASPQLQMTNVTYNTITGNSGNVIFQSNDSSITSNLTKEENKIFESLRSEIESKIENNHEILQLLTEMQNSAGHDSFKEKYNSFIQGAANHMTIIAPFIPALSGFLTR